MAHANTPFRMVRLPGGRSVGWLLIQAIAIAGTSFLTYALVSNQAITPSTPTVVTPNLRAITALGRLEPDGEVVNVAASARGSRIAKLFVQQGDRLQAGQIIAHLDTYPTLNAALARAHTNVQVARTQLAQVQAGAKQGEIQAQQAAIARIQAQLQQDVAARAAVVARLQAEWSNADLEYRRYEALYQTGAVSASARDSKRLTLDALTEQVREAQANRSQTAATLSAQLREAQATLARIAEVRPVDVAAAQAQVDSAIAAVQQANADRDLAIIRAPRAGQILKVHTWAGEVVGDRGIVALGQTQQMMAVAEVYESDIIQVRQGQLAQITIDSIPGTFQGTVDEIGLEVAKKDVLSTDPAADVDARVVEVKIRLQPRDSQRLASLTNLKVQVAITL